MSKAEPYRFLPPRGHHGAEAEGVVLWEPCFDVVEVRAKEAPSGVSPAALACLRLAPDVWWAILKPKAPLSPSPLAGEGAVRRTADEGSDPAIGLTSPGSLPEPPSPARGEGDAGEQQPISIGDGLHWFGIAGRATRFTLSKLCRLDLHPSAFPPDHATRTIMVQVPVMLWRVADSRTHSFEGTSPHDAGAIPPREGRVARAERSAGRGDDAAHVWTGSPSGSRSASHLPLTGEDHAAAGPDAPAFLLAVPLTFAHSFAHALTGAASESGYRVASTQDVEIDED